MAMRPWYYEGSPASEDVNFRGRWTPILTIILVLIIVMSSIGLILQKYGSDSVRETYARAFMLVPDRIFQGQGLWTFLTYIFVHLSFLQLAFTVMLLWFFGRCVEGRLGAWRFLALLATCAVCSGLVCCIASKSVVAGAGGLVISMIVAGAVSSPDSQMFGIVRLKHAGIVAFVFALVFCLFQKEPSQGETSLPPLVNGYLMLGGAISSCLFILAESRLLGQRSTPTVAAVTEKSPTTATSLKNKRLEAQLDSILDKINREGISRLSRSERSFLKKVSRQLKRKQ